jgi:hypothetical protein
MTSRAAAGLLGGVLALCPMKVCRSEKTGRPVSAAGGAHALLWIFVIGARVLFSYGASHWFENQLGSRLAMHSIPSAAITDVLIFIAVAMVLTRAVGLAARTRSVSGSREVAMSSPDFTRA